MKQLEVGRVSAFFGLNAMKTEGRRPGRRLAAILAADVAGYSRLIGADEEWTRVTR